MPVAGTFPGMKELMRRPIPAPVNPLDKSTVVSIFPKEIHETKPTLQPSDWVIPAGMPEKPGILVVGPSSWWKDVGEDQPLIEIPVSSVQIAESLVRDYCNGYLGADMGAEVKPGLFFIPGVWSQKQVMIDHKALLDAAIVKQNIFYNTLVRMADAFWSRTNGNPLAISDDMRMAAKLLGLEGKEWLANFEPATVIRCVACGQIRNPSYPVCPHCKAVVDVEMAAKLGIQFAK